MAGTGLDPTPTAQKRILLALWLVAMAAFVVRAARAQAAVGSAATAAVAVGLLLAFYLALADSAFVFALSRAVTGGARGLVGALAIFALPAAYGAATHQLSMPDVILLLLYPALSWALVAWDTRRRPDRIRLTVRLALAILLLWMPLELDLLPRVMAPPGGPFNMVPLCTLCLALLLFLAVRQLPGMGLTADLRRPDLSQAAILFAVFLAFFAIPIGISLRFAQSTHRPLPLYQWPVTALAIFLLTALPEEVLFRGIIQNLFERTMPGRPTTTLVLASLIFGLSHVDNPSPPFLSMTLLGRHFAIPWLYVVLATIAGVFYGLAYRRTGKITVSALVHGLVDTWWVLFFRR
jgi:CAAX protease family protein